MKEKFNTGRLIASNARRTVRSWDLAKITFSRLTKHLCTLEQAVEKLLEENLLVNARVCTDK